MSRQIDITKKLSDDDRAYLTANSDWNALRLNQAYLEGAEFLEDEAEPMGAGSEPLKQDPEPEKQAGDGAQSEYDDLTNEELQAILKSRDLAVSGNKAELIDRLKESDSKS